MFGKFILVPLIAAAAALFPAFASSMEIGALQGSWELTKVDGKTISASTRQRPFFTISRGSISGYDGCNRFDGPLGQPDKIMRTQRACAGRYVKLPLDFADPISHLQAGKIAGGRLILPPHGGSPASEFRRR